MFELIIHNYILLKQIHILETLPLCKDDLLYSEVRALCNTRRWWHHPNLAAKHRSSIDLNAHIRFTQYLFIPQFFVHNCRNKETSGRTKIN